MAKRRTRCDARTAKLVSQILDLEEAARRLAFRSPSLFRRNLYLDANSKVPFASEMQPFQKQDLRALQSAWKQLAFGIESQTKVIRRAYFERPRGHSKTTDTAVQMLWILLASNRRLQGLAAAADLEQAGLLKEAIERILDANPHLARRVSVVADAVRSGSNGCELKFISSDVSSSWGELPDFVVCDELCHWKSQGLWESLLSSAAKKPQSVMVVLSNAGTGRDWHWQVREHARTDPNWHFSSLDGPQAPWITPESLEEQRRMLPPAVFARLWLNQWQDTAGEFVSLPEAQACRDDQLTARDYGLPDFQYVAAIDYAEKHDFTVGCVCHREGAVVIVDCMDVVRPTVDSKTPVHWVRTWMENTAARFPDLRFVIDEHQLVSVIQELEHRYRITRYRFLGGQANHDMALTLRQLILERAVRWYPGCGAVLGEEQAVPPDNLETELASLIVRESSGGRFRFDHRRDGRSHDDRAFALGAACQMLVSVTADGPPLLEVTPPEQGLLRF